MGQDYDKSKALNICLIGGEEKLIEKIFPESVKESKNIKYKKRRKFQKIEAKNLLTGKTSKIKFFGKHIFSPI